MNALRGLTAVGDAFGEEHCSALHEARVRRQIQEHRIGVVQ